MKKITIMVLFTVFILASAAETLLAIPAFARKYRMSCQTCHSPMPRLKSYGNDFAGNGFTLSDQEAPRYYVDTGDELLNLIRDFPIAVRMEAFTTYRTDKPKRGDFKFPYLIKFLSGGAIADNLAYYFYMYFDERGEVAGVEDAYLMYNNLFGVDLDVYAGQFQISDPLFKRELRLTLEDYQIYKTKVGESNFNLAYDRGLMFTYGMDTGTDLVLEILNGNGLADADDNHMFDNDNYKNLFGRISQDVGENIRIGAFAYHGKELQNANAFSELENTLLIFGPDITLSLNDKFELNLQYVQRSDDWSYKQNIVDQKIETKGAFAELIYTPEGDDSKWYAVGLFNWIESDIADLNYKSLTGHAGYMLRRNLRLVSEVKYDMLNEYLQVGVGFISAF